MPASITLTEILVPVKVAPVILPASTVVPDMVTPVTTLAVKPVPDICVPVTAPASTVVPDMLVPVTVVAWIRVELTNTALVSEPPAKVAIPSVMVLVR